jgi:hypothetical protein
MSTVANRQSTREYPRLTYLRRRAVALAGVTALVLFGAHEVKKVNDNNSLAGQLKHPSEQVLRDYKAGKIDHDKVEIVPTQENTLPWQEAERLAGDEGDVPAISDLISEQVGDGQVGVPEVVLPRDLLH